MKSVSPQTGHGDLAQGWNGLSAIIYGGDAIASTLEWGHGCISMPVAGVVTIILALEAPDP
jgi:hypothetical protein